MVEGQGNKKRVLERMELKYQTKFNREASEGGEKLLVWEQKEHSEYWGAQWGGRTGQEEQTNKKNGKTELRD